jgi:hypothetical protein
VCEGNTGPPYLDEAAVGGCSCTTGVDGRLSLFRQVCTEHQRAAERLFVMLKLSAAHFVYQVTQVDAGNTVEPAEATRRLVPARERVYGMRTQSPVTSTSGRDEGAMLMLIIRRDSRLTTSAS